MNVLHQFELLQTARSSSQATIRRHQSVIRTRRTLSRASRCVATSSEGGGVKFTPAVVRENKAASGDDKFRLLVLSVEDKWKRVETLKGTGRPGQESPRWLDAFTAPGQVIAIAVSPEVENGKNLSRRQQLRKSLLLPIASTPYEVRRDSAFIDSSIVEVLVDVREGLQLKGPDGEEHTLAELGAGFELMVSEPEGRGFTSVIDPNVGLQSALEEGRNLLLLGSGPVGIAALRCVIEWQPVAAHAGVHNVSVFLAAPSAAGAPFLSDFDKWREAGYKLHPVYGPGGASNILQELFKTPSNARDACGGVPAKAAVLVCGIEGDVRVKLNKSLQEAGFEPERIFFADLL